MGVDTIIAEAGVAKMTLYRNFTSKDELVLAFLRAARGALDARVAAGRGRSSAPRSRGERLLAIFDVFGEWFAREDFEGCAFINVLLELDDRGTRSAWRSVEHLANIRGFVGARWPSRPASADPDALVAASGTSS